MIKHLDHLDATFDLGKYGSDVVQIMFYLQNGELCSKMVFSAGDNNDEYHLSHNISPNKLRDLADFLEQSIQKAKAEVGTDD